MMKQKNLIFIFSDQQHWQAIGVEDAWFETPNLNGLISDGVHFKNSYCTTPQCSPSRSSMLTGFYPSKTGVMGNVGKAGGEPLKMETIGAKLQEADYYTAYFGKWHLGKEPVGIKGWDEDFGVTGEETTNDDLVSNYALKFIQMRKEDDKPFALFLSYNNPHDIYHFSKENGPFQNNNIELPKSFHEVNRDDSPAIHQQFMDEDQGHVIVNEKDDAWRRYREIYRDKVKLYDNHVGLVFNELKNNYFYDDALIIATSDHGDMDTHHRLIYKGPFMFDQMMRVPLIMKLPNYLNIKNKSIDTPTVNIDPVPTILELLDIPIPNVDGISLKSVLLGVEKKLNRDFIIGEYYSKQDWVNPIRMICMNGYKYNYYVGNGEELFDMSKDPEELNSLVNDKSFQTLKAELKSKLDEWIKNNDDPFYSYSVTSREGKSLN
ncbi:MAG: hypothetical protein COA79_04650 [Planctomycetota bacterium]|nr:MAG: hypothetical protein COA79_04650 [Planctomycetota bacterium]